MLKQFFLFFILLFSSRYFSMISIDPRFIKISTTFVCLGILGFLLIKNKLLIKHSYTQKFIIAFILLPFLSCFPAYLLHNQDLITSIKATLFNITYICFFLLFAIKAETKDIIKSFCILGCLWTIIQAIQQFTYPTYLFASRPDTLDTSIEIRNGIYRYAVIGTYFGVFLTFYCFEKILLKKNILHLLGFFLGLIGIYLTTTRQIIASVLLCLGIGLIKSKKIKPTSFFLFLIIGVILYQYSDILFGEFIENTQNVDEDYIRFQTFTFFGLEYSTSILSMILGNGQYSTKSSYGEEILKFQDFGMYQSDIGLVGLYSIYGIIYITNILILFYFLYRKRKYLDLYLQLYFIYLFITSIMLIHFGYNVHSIICICFILYLADKSIYKNTIRKV